MTDILDYNVLNKIYKQLQGEIGIPDDINIISKEVNITYDDLSAGGKISNIVLDEIPPECTLVHGELYLTEEFTDGSGNAYLNVGLGSDERLDTDRDPSTYVHNKLVFDALTLDTTGSNVMQGELADVNVTKRLNLFRNTLSAGFYMLGSWTAANDVNQAVWNSQGCGTQTSGLKIGGDTSNKTESYDGVSWANENNLLAARGKAGAAGSQMASLTFGGTGPLNTTEEYDGSSWSAGGNLGVATDRIAGCGTQTAGLGFGGLAGGLYLATSQEYNGAAWTSGNPLNINRGMESGGVGTQTAAMTTCGHDGSSSIASTEEYDGTSWLISNDMNESKYNNIGAGVQNAALTAGGWGTGNSSTSSEYDGTSWIATNDMNAARNELGGFGVQNAAIVYCSDVPIATSEEYDSVLLSSLTGGELTLYLTYSHQ